MSDSLFDPRTHAQNRAAIDRYQVTFDAGAFFDIPSGNIPANGTGPIKNLINLGDRLKGRSGSRKWSDTPLPALEGRTGYAATKTAYIITKTVGADFTAADVGNYFVHDNGKHDRIEEYIDTDMVRVANNTARPASGNGKVRGPVNGKWYHKTEKKIIIHIDKRLFIASDIRITSWIQAFCIKGHELDNSVSTICEYRNYLFVFNSNGIFRLNILNIPYIYYCINTDIPQFKITGANNSDSTSYPYMARYLYSCARLSGALTSDDNVDRNRQTAGVEIEQESGTVSAAVDSNYQDYGEVRTERPIGDGTTSYQKITGGTLVTPYDVVSGWSGISNGQAHAKINGIEYNFAADFTDCESMSDVAARIQTAMRDFWQLITVEYSIDHFIISNPVEGGTIENTALGIPISAGDAGTNIGDNNVMKCGASGTITTVNYTNPVIVSTLTLPTIGGVPEQHWTHYPIYRSLNLGVNGRNPLTGEVNQSELYIWDMDAPVAKAFTASIDSSGNITIERGMLVSQDKGCSIVNIAGTTVLINTVVSGGLTGTVLNSDGSAYSQGTILSTSWALGGGTTMTASQDVVGDETLGAATITKVEGRDFVAADSGKPFFWADGSMSLMVKYVSATKMEVAEDDAIVTMAGTIDPVSRKFCDTTRDEDLRSRISVYSLVQRLWEALPSCDIGCITPGMMWAADSDTNDMYYSQMIRGYEYMTGYYNPSKQTTSFTDQIRTIKECPDYLIIFCSNSTHGVPLNTFNTETIPEVGVVVTTISGQTPLDRSIGIHDSGSIASIPRGGFILITNEPGLRMFDGRSYSEDYAENRLTKTLRTLQAGMACIYNAITGFVFWGLDE